MSKEPNINEEKIAIEKAVRKDKRTMEDYIVNRVESLERTINQQNALIGMLDKDIEEYRRFVDFLKAYAKEEGGIISIYIWGEDKDKNYAMKMLGLEETTPSAYEGVNIRK